MIKLIMISMMRVASVVLTVFYGLLCSGLTSPYEIFGSYDDMTRFVSLINTLRENEERKKVFFF